MIRSFATALDHLALANFKSWEKSHFRGTLMPWLPVLFTGTFFYTTIEGWSVVDSLYFNPATAATVGFGDLTSQTALGKIFTVV